MLRLQLIIYTEIIIMYMITYIIFNSLTLLFKDYLYKLQKRKYNINKFYENFKKKSLH